MPLPLSVLDLSPVSAGSTAGEALRNTLDLARHADRLGYTRYWLAEHHNITSIASTTPELMIGLVACETEHIRVGSGGVMLPNHAPLKVVETFRMLEALFPGRIDLGIGRAPGTDPLTAYALRRAREGLAADEFPEQLAELRAFATNSFPEDHPFRAISAGSPDVPLPPIFILGSSGYGAQLAASLGLGCAFAHHINPQAAVFALQIYRARFMPSPERPHPWAILAVSAACAETEEQAEDLAASLELMYLRLRSGRPSPITSPEEAKSYPYTPAEQAKIAEFRSNFMVGTPDVVRARLLELAEQTGADEIMVTTVTHSHAARVRSYELLAKAFALEPRTVGAGGAV